MKVLVSRTTAELKEKGSKFICFLYPMGDAKTFELELSRLRQEHPKANHVCNAYRILVDGVLNEKASDDGEPRYTAGAPILNQLKSFDVVNVGAFVVRYFGGTKLGASGLISAYKQSTLMALENVALKPYVELSTITLVYSYDDTAHIESVLSRFTTSIIDSEYTENVKQRIQIPAEEVQTFEAELKAWIVN